MTEHPKLQTYRELPEHVRVWLEGLSKEDLVLAKEGMKLAQATKTVGRFWKYTLITMAAVLITTASMGQSIVWLWNLLRGK